MPDWPVDLQFYPLPDLSSGLTGLRVAADDSVWLLTRQSIIMLQPEAGAQTYLSDFAGTLLGMDDHRRVWVLAADSQTIAAWDGVRWVTYDVQAGWEPLSNMWSDLRGSLVTDVGGQVWLALGHHMRRFDGERWMAFDPDDLGMPLEERDDAIPAWTLTAGRDGRLWAGECDWGGPGPVGGAGVRWWEDQRWHGADSPVASGCVTVIREDSSGRVWVGLDDMLWRYDPATGQWDDFALPTAPQGARFGYIVDLTIDPAGETWLLLSLCGGASCDNGRVYVHLHDDAWTQVGEIDEYFVGELVFDRAGTPWLFTATALARVEGDTPVALIMGRIWDVAVDGAGRIWFVAEFNSQFGLWELRP